MSNSGNKNFEDGSVVLETEHERRFLVSVEDLPLGYFKSPSKYLVQGYPGDGSRVRSERDNSGVYEYFRERKTGEGVSREEVKQRLTKDTFNELFETVVCSLEKTRYYYPIDGGHVAEINCFHGKLHGYYQIEVEFTSAEAAAAFVPPSWFGLEVTDDPKHSSYQLALQSKSLFA